MNQFEQAKKILQELKIDAYIIPTSDFHNSEYICDHFKGRAFLSGFTGSAGTLVITKEEGRLWTDGRYFIQAQKELENSGIHLMKIGVENFPTIPAYLKSILKEGSTLGFDGRVLNTQFVESLKNELSALTINYKSDYDLIEDVWKDRPPLPNSTLFKLDDFFTGENYQSKIKRLREKMKEANATYHILASLEDQAWLYNMRADDILHTPVFLSFTIITKEQNYLFINKDKLNEHITQIFKEYKVIIKNYTNIYDFVSTIENQNILLDKSSINYAIYNKISPSNTILSSQNPTLLMKAIKNETELKNIRYAHVKDGVACTKLIYFLKKNIGKKTFTELSVSDYLAELRSQNEGFIDLSFSTICAYQENAAMMHYSANEKNNATLKNAGFLLIDSGGHYLDGSTDITRTIALGTLSETMKLHFTTVLQSMINLSTATFLKGCNGINLDILARGPIWDLMIDYKCGTGHGIGYLLSVHEAPNGFRWQKVPERNDSAIFEIGMVTTNEPGIYLENQYGIRLENEMAVVPVGENNFGTFYGFETITYVPIDLDAINASLLTAKQKQWINLYHHEVYNKISPFLSADEREWLREYTKEI